MDASASAARPSARTKGAIASAPASAALAAPSASSASGGAWHWEPRYGLTPIVASAHPSRVRASASAGVASSTRDASASAYPELARANRASNDATQSARTPASDLAEGDADGARGVVMTREAESARGPGEARPDATRRDKCPPRRESEEKT
jgi:hypothetical protein